MRQTIVVPALLLGLACGGERGAQPSSRPAAAPPAAAPVAPAATGTVHEVKMQLVKNKYSFEPAAITIKVGDTVKWINFSGGPHNVSFKKDEHQGGRPEREHAEPHAGTGGHRPVPHRLTRHLPGVVRERSRRDVHVHLPAA